MKEKLIAFLAKYGAWILTAFFLISAFVFMPSLSSLLMLLLALLLAPIERLKDYISKLIPLEGLKTTLIVILAVVAIVAAPVGPGNDKSDKNGNEDKAAQEAIINESDTEYADAASDTLVDESENVSDLTESIDTEYIPDIETVANTEESIVSDVASDTETTHVPLSDSGGDTETYLLNTNTKKFHRVTCKRGPTKEENKAFFTGTRDEIISQGYSPCGICKP